MDKDNRKFLAKLVVAIIVILAAMVAVSLFYIKY